jgi:O-antigen/teichoic acid export membrane protein
MNISKQKIAWALAGNAVDIAIGFGSLILVTRFYPKEQAGKWFVFTALFALLANMREGYVQGGMVKHSVGVDPATQYKVYLASFFSNLFIELAMSAAMLAASFLMADPVLSLLFWLYPAYSLPYALYRWLFFVFRSKLEVHRTFLMNSLFLVILITGSAWMVIHGEPLHHLVALLGSCSLTSFLLGTLLFSLKPIFRAGFSRPIFLQLFALGKHGVLKELTGTLSTRINIFLTAGLLDFGQTALLGVAQRYTVLFMVPHNAIKALLFPVLVQQAHTGNQSLLKQTFEAQVGRLLAMLFPVALAIALMAPMVTQWLHGAQYQTAAPLLWIMLLTLALFSPFGTAFGSTANAIGQPRFNTQVIMVNSLINIGLTYGLIRSLGLWGAVMAPFITELIGFCWIQYLLRKTLGIRFANSFGHMLSFYKIQLRRWMPGFI